MKRKNNYTFGATFLLISIVIGTLVLYFPFSQLFTTPDHDKIPEPYEDFKIIPIDKSNADVMGASTVQPKGTVKIPVLMYHQIGQVPKKGSSSLKGLYVTPYMFDLQMKYLKLNGYKTLTPLEFYNYLKAGKNPPQKSVLITFDDGSRGQYKYAFPTLKKNKQTATFYIISQRSSIRGKELKLMAKNGMIIDSHSSTHKDLKALNDKKQLAYEISSSRAQLQYLTGQKVYSIAYPGCVADTETFNQVAASGYLLGFSCGRSIYHRFSSRLSLSRIHVFNDMKSFKRALTIGL